MQVLHRCRDMSRCLQPFPLLQDEVVATWRYVQLTRHSLQQCYCLYAGFFFGRTPLIKLSPKKTWEGFIGGFLGTVVSAFFLAKWFSQYKWMTCPRQVSCCTIMHVHGDACCKDEHMPSDCEDGGALDLWPVTWQDCNTPQRGDVADMHIRHCLIVAQVYVFHALTAFVACLHRTCRLVSLTVSQMRSSRCRSSLWTAYKQACRNSWQSWYSHCSYCCQLQSWKHSKTRE